MRIPIRQSSGPTQIGLPVRVPGFAGWVLRWSDGRLTFFSDSAKDRGEYPSPADPTITPTLRERLTDLSVRKLIPQSAPQPQQELNLDNPPPEKEPA